MRYPAYSEYKESGVQWLGQVPGHWEVKKLRYLTSKIGSGKTPSGGATTYIDEGVMFIRSQNVYDDGLRLDDVVYIDETIDAEMQNSRVQSYDVLLNITGASLGRTCIVPESFPKANVNQHVCIIRQSDNNRSVFVSWMLKSAVAKAQITSAQTGSGREGLNFEQISKFLITLPPQVEQTAIADFLDRETGRIDTLVAKKRRLIALLKEKRTALISRTVTRGLPADAAREFGLEPHTRFKDSGIEWLGQVPEGWEPTHLKYATSMIVDCPHETPQYDSDGSYHVVRTADLSLGLLDLSNSYRVAEDEYLRRVRRAPVMPGDILYSREGERWGFAATAPITPKVCLGQRMMQFRAASSFKPRYLMWHLNASCVYEQGVLDTAGSTAPHVNVSTIRNYWLAAPPLPEQTAIATYLDRETERIDRLMAKVETAIARLQEYRTALITAAVTGKIDVREAVNGVDRVDEVTLEVGCGG